MRFRVALVILFALAVVPAHAADELREVAFLVGEWKGEAWIQSGPGKGERAIQTERVQSKLGGKLILIEGVGRRKLEDGAAGEIVHDAMAVISYDEKTKKYRFDAWTARNGYTPAWLEPGEGDSLRWGFDTPAGKVRYSISLTDKGEWLEIGEFSRDGSQWMQFMEMRLTKVK